MQAAPSSSTVATLGGETANVVSGVPERADVSALESTPRLRGRYPGGTNELMQDASHLLNALRTYSELMTLPGVLAEEYRHVAHELQVLSDRSATMLGRLKWVDAPEKSTGGDERAAVATVLPEAALDLLGMLSRMTGRAVTFFCSPSAYFPVAVSRPAFEGILINLVSHAAAAGAGGGSVAVTLVGMRHRAQDDMLLVLTVQSRERGNGSGQPRSGTTRTTKPTRNIGRSLGFEVARELAEGSGARIEVEGDLHAASVSVSWPVIDPRRSRQSAGKLAMAELQFSGMSGLESGGTVVLAGGGAC